MIMEGEKMERRINGHTRLYALIGSPVGHSGSPAMYNYSFEKLGIDAAYLAFDIPLEKTKDAIDAFRTLNVGGFNITMPNKTAAAQLVDRLSPAAELVGACNTVVVEEDKTMTGHITESGERERRSFCLVQAERRLRSQYRRRLIKRQRLRYLTGRMNFSQTEKKR